MEVEGIVSEDQPYAALVCGYLCIVRLTSNQEESLMYQIGLLVLR